MKLVQHRHSASSQLRQSGIGILAGSQLRQSGIGIRTVGHGFDRHCPCPALTGDNLLTMTSVVVK